VEKVAAIVGHSLLEKMQLPLHLRGDEQDIGDHLKKGAITVENEKVSYLLQYDIFMGMRDGIWGLLEMLLLHLALSDQAS
jgi:hypothetical protein